jgi:invasion protein IalB
LVEAEPFAALRLGHTLKMAITVPNGRQIDRPVTLKGFATAIQRGIELSD